jgi:ABC-type Fe3+/spermidine/putrescine transport system ATPase subunit
VDTALGRPWTVAGGPASAGPGEVWLGVRPEALRLSPPVDAATMWNAAEGRVTEVTYLGAVARYQVEAPAGISLTAEVHDPDFATLRAVGDTIHLWCDPARVHLLAPDG